MEPPRGAAAAAVGGLSLWIRGLGLLLLLPAVPAGPGQDRLDAPQPLAAGTRTALLTGPPGPSPGSRLWGAEVGPGGGRRRRSPSGEDEGCSPLQGIEASLDNNTHQALERSCVVWRVSTEKNVCLFAGAGRAEPQPIQGLKVPVGDFWDPRHSAFYPGSSDCLPGWET